MCRNISSTIVVRQGQHVTRDPSGRRERELAALNLVTLSAASELPPPPRVQRHPPTGTDPPVLNEHKPIPQDMSTWAGGG